MMAYSRRCVHSEALWQGATDEEVIFLRRVSKFCISWPLRSGRNRLGQIHLGNSHRSSIYASILITLFLEQRGLTGFTSVLFQ